MKTEKLEKGDKMKIDSLSAGEKRVYDYMKANGGITTLEALQKLGCTRLSARIFDLRSAGIPVYDEWETVINRYGEPCHVKRYYIGKKTK